MRAGPRSLVLGAFTVLVPSWSRRCPDARTRPSAAPRRQAVFDAGPADDAGLLPEEDARAAREEYGRRMTRLGQLARRHGFDALIVLAGARGSDRGGAPAAARRRHRTPAAGSPRSPWCSSCCPLLARRRLPFAAPACLWLAGRRALVRRRAARRLHRRRLHRRAWPPRSCSATCPTRSRDASAWPSCSAARPWSSTTTRSARPATWSSSRSCSASAGSSASPSASGPRRPRRPRPGPARPSASARRWPGSRWPRSAPGSPASCTTSSPTRSP